MYWQCFGEICCNITLSIVLLIILCFLVWHSSSWTGKTWTFLSPVPICCGSVIVYRGWAVYFSMLMEFLALSIWYQYLVNDLKQDLHYVCLTLVLYEARTYSHAKLPVDFWQSLVWFVIGRYQVLVLMIQANLSSDKQLRKSWVEFQLQSKYLSSSLFSKKL